VSDWRDVRPWMSLTLSSERSRRRRTARRLPAAASFHQRRRQVRLAYPQRPHVIRRWNVFSRSALQRSSALELGKWKVNMAGCFAKVTLWPDRGRQHEPHPRPLQRGGRAGREQQHEPHPRPLLRSGRTRSRHSCSSRRPQGAVQRRHERYHRHAGDARQGSRRCFFRVSPAPVPTAHTTLARESWLQL